MKHIRETLKRVRDTEAAEKTWDLEIEMAALAETLSAYWNIEVVLCENVQTLAVTTTSMFNLQQFLREAVSNAVRHGRAALVTVDFSSDGGYLRFVVTDNGSGFREEPAKTYPKSLQERIAGLGGTIDVQSLPGGTRLEVLIDVQRLTTPSILPSGDTG